jgi:hypothetical protein
MTNEEFNERYKDVELTFDHYWKYVFYYKGIGKDGETITCGYGGMSDSIYRYEVINNKKERVTHYDCWMYITVVDGEKTIYEFTDF